MDLMEKYGKVYEFEVSADGLTSKERERRIRDELLIKNAKEFSLENLVKEYTRIEKLYLNNKNHKNEREIILSKEWRINAYYKNLSESRENLKTLLRNKSQDIIIKEHNGKSSK